MNRLLESRATWTRAAMLVVVANVDAEILQWPGGSVLTLVLGVFALIAVAVEFVLRRAWRPALASDGSSAVSAWWRRATPLWEFPVH